jgi:hypothetical protein
LNNSQKKKVFGLILFSPQILGFAGAGRREPSIEHLAQPKRPGRRGPVNPLDLKKIKCSLDFLPACLRHVNRQAGLDTFSSMEKVSERQTKKMKREIYQEKRNKRKHYFSATHHMQQ